MHATFEQTDQIYGETDFSSLEADVNKIGRKLYFDIGTVMQPREGEIMIVLDGIVSVSNSADEDSLVMGLTYHLMPVGLIERYYKNLPLFYKVEQRLTVAQMNYEDFDAIFLHQSKNAEFFSHIMVHLSALLIQVYYERNSESGYATIREMLFRYMYRVESESFKSEGIATFILRRTRLSRSYVFQILSSLKTGGYITVKNGRLVSIDRDIPIKY